MIEAVAVVAGTWVAGSFTTAALYGWACWRRRPRQADMELAS